MEKSALLEKLIKYYRTCTHDRYGQIKTIDIFAITKDPEEQKELAKYVRIGTYAWQYGEYLAFRPWGAFKDAEVERLCREAHSQNENYKEAMCGW